MDENVSQQIIALQIVLKLKHDLQAQFALDLHMLQIVKTAITSGI